MSRYRKEVYDTEQETAYWVDRYYKLAIFLEKITAKSCNNCTKECTCMPEWGEPVRYNCPYFKLKEENQNDYPSESRERVEGRAPTNP